MTRVYVDIETYSSVDLPKTGVYRYAESDDFLILMSAWSVDGSDTWVETDEQATRETLSDYLADPDVTFVAHNAQFERVCFSRLLGLPVGTYLDPARWHDTQAVAAEHGYPQGLDALAKALGGEQKDSAGTRLINRFSKPNRKGQRNLPEDHPDEWMDFMAYCAQDVVTTVDVDRALGDWPTKRERLVYLVDQHVNDRGIRIDTDLASRAVDAAEANRMVQEMRFTEITDVANPGSHQQVLRWLQTHVKPSLKNLQAATITRLLEHPRLKPEQREVLELRQELALVASKKYATALRSVSPDDRLRGTLKFFGAHTGRWSGRGTQLQNLPREAFTYIDEHGKERHDLAAEAMAIYDLKNGDGASAMDLKRLVRPLFLVDGCVVDYSSIEARVIAWLAGEQWALGAFRRERDIYVETAERMSTPDRPLTRSQGKVAVLALGYAGGVNSLRVMGADGSDEDLQRLVGQWRKANPHIVRLWSLLENAVGETSDGQRTAVGDHLAVSRQGETMRLHLPSGRAITYHGVRWENYRVQDPKTKRMVPKRGWRYDDPKRAGQRIGTYGGRLAENVTQAVARDVLAEALIRLHRAGYAVVSHVHDEIIVEHTTDVADVSRIMCELPRWATGLPVDAEGFTTERYAKG